MGTLLSNKTAELAANFKGMNIRPEVEAGDNEGDAGDFVPGREFALVGIALTKNQYESIVGKGSTDRHFNKPVGKPWERADKTWSVLRIDDVYKNCGAKFKLGHVSGKEIDIPEGVKIKNISIKLLDEGNERKCATMRCTVQAAFPMNLVTLHMETFKGKEIQVSLRFGSVDDSDKSEEEKQTDLVEAARVAEENATDVNSKKGGDEARLN